MGPADGFELPPAATAPANSPPANSPPLFAESSDGVPTPPPDFIPQPDEDDDDFLLDEEAAAQAEQDARYAETFVPEPGDTVLYFCAPGQPPQPHPLPPVPDLASDTDWKSFMEKQIADQLADEQKKKERHEKRMLKLQQQQAARSKWYTQNPAAAKKQAQKELAAQRSGFEAFSNTLLHSVSPFMPPLRELCGASLPHLKMDQRYGKRGAPHTGVAHFIIAPVVANYRPIHFHDLTPGDLMEYHHDLSLVLRKGVDGVTSMMINYGPEWKMFSVPFAYLSCADYTAQVSRLCPNETPNTRTEAVYEDDIIKDITDFVLSIPELEPLQSMSFVDCAAKRINLMPLYEVLNDLFKPIGNYQIQIRELFAVPSRIHLKTSGGVLSRVPSPIVIAGDSALWEQLPSIDPLHHSRTQKAATSAAVGPSTAVSSACGVAGPPTVATKTTGETPLGGAATAATTSRSGTPGQGALMATRLAGWIGRVRCSRSSCA